MTIISGTPSIKSPDSYAYCQSKKHIPLDIMEKWKYQGLCDSSERDALSVNAGLSLCAPIGSL